MDFKIWKHEDRFKFSQKPIKCPKCQIDMVIINYEDTDVEIDYCPQCQGTWLGEGEFNNIIDAINSELANKSMTAERQHRLRQLIELARDAYCQGNGRQQTSLEELLQAGYLKDVPEDPYGGSFYLDSEGGVKTTSKFDFKTGTDENRTS